jgi:NADPH-dependent 2,4-dienoyl-CoA reductase/sulfur reductase-like enzyme
MKKKRAVILGAGFAGLELAARLSDSLADEVRVTLLDQNDSFSFGFSKLDILLGRKRSADVLLDYGDISKEGSGYWTDGCPGPDNEGGLAEHPRRSRGERDRVVPNQLVAQLDSQSKEARLASGTSLPYDLFIGIPVHGAPEVVVRSGLAVDGWVPVDHTNLTTRFSGVYAVGDVAGTPVAKAGVFAEAAAGVVADDIAARLRGGVLERRYEGAGSCYLEFGGGMVGKVEANFLGGPAPTAQLVGPSLELAAEKEEFAAVRRERWFGP